MRSLEIRNINTDDLTELAKIYAETYTFFDVGERWTQETAHQMLLHWLKKQPDLCFLAEHEGTIVGAFVVGLKPWWDGNHLSDGEIFVHPHHQKKGIGTALLKHVFMYALQKYHVVQWDAYTVKNKYPLEWYKRIGFEEIEEWVMISADPKEVLKKLT